MGMGVRSRLAAWIRAVAGAATGAHASPVVLPPYRDVVSRHRDGNEESVVLSCGHAYVLNYRERACFPCVSCLEEGSVPSIPGALQPPPAEQSEAPTSACDPTKKEAQ